jgi:hypothetical protein
MREAYPVGQKIPKPGRVTLYVGKPLTELSRLKPEDLSARVMNALADLLESNGHGDYLEASPAGG